MYDSNEELYYELTNIPKQTKTGIYKINIDNISINFLDNQYVENHKDMWHLMGEKYEFMDKSVKFDESVYLTKELINNQMKN